MKHCPNCREEYEDWAPQCAECSGPLNKGAVRNACPNCAKEYPAGHLACADCGVDFSSESGAAAKGEPAEPSKPEDAETVFAGPRTMGEPLALALSRAGIPALTFACDPLAAGEAEGGDSVEVVVPVPLYDAANWFVQGFEAALLPPPEEDEEEPPPCC
jgi:predicted amidophosphoribosyltransferase